MGWNISFTGSMKEELQRAPIHGNYPRLTPRTGHLAVVGGGASALRQLEDLRAWKGDIWGLNQTAAWLLSEGVDCELFTVDRSHLVAPEVVGVKRAVIDDLARLQRDQHRHGSQRAHLAKRRLHVRGAFACCRAGICSQKREGGAISGAFRRKLS